MNNFLLLCKSQIFWNKIAQAQDTKLKSIAKGLIVGLLIVAAMAILALITYSLVSINLGDVAVTIAIGGSGIFVLITSVIRASGTLFSFKDFNLLMSLPISKLSLIAAKYVGVYAPCLAISSIITIPMLISFCIFSCAEIKVWFFAIFAILATPLIPVTIGSLIALFVSYLGSKFKRSSTYSGFLSIILLCIAMIAYYGFFAKNLKSNISEESLSSFSSILSPVSWINAGISNGNFIEFAYFIAISLLTSALTILLLSKAFIKISLSMSQSSGGASFSFSSSQENRTSSSPTSSICKKEIRQLFNNSTLIGNSLFGIAFAFLVAIVFFICKLTSNNPTSIISSILGTSGFFEIQSMPSVFFSMSFAPISMLAWIISYFTTSPLGACIFSLEQSSRWILQTSPLSSKDIIKAKFRTLSVIYLPLVALSGILLAIDFANSLTCALGFIVIPISVSMTSYSIGFYFNARKPNYTWTNVTDVVKRGLSVSLAMLSGFVVSTIGLILTIFIGEISTIIVPALLIALSLCLVTKAEKLSPLSK